MKPVPTTPTLILFINGYGMIGEKQSALAG
jgi:hypothetical protein